MPEIEILTGTQVLKTRSLWEEVFTEDSKSFVDYYYSYKAMKNICFVIGEQNEIVSMVHLTPYDMCVVRRDEVSQETDKVQTDTFPSFYIVGVATKEAYRHKGYMTALLEYAFSYMRKNNIEITFLMPANPAIYQPFGFQYIYERTDYLFSPKYLNQGHELLNFELRKAEKKDCEMLSSFSMEQLKVRYDFFLKRDVAYFQTLLMELASENGFIYLIYVNGEFAGYFAHACEEEEFVQEVLIKEYVEPLLVVEDGNEGLLIRKSWKKPIIMGKYLGGNARFEPFLQNIAEGRIKNGFINEVV